MADNKKPKQASTPLPCFLFERPYHLTLLRPAVRGCLLFTFLFAFLLPANPIPVRYPEGTTHGFLVVHDLSGKSLAAGDLTQSVRGARVTSRLAFRFKDGSEDEETTSFTQRGTFCLISDRHIQKGPVFPKPLDVFIDVPSGRVVTRTQDKGKTEVLTDKMDLPPDLANGMLLYVMKNMGSDLKQVNVPFLASLPKPRIVRLDIAAHDSEVFTIANLKHDATRFTMKVQLGGVTGMVAPLIGKEPATDNFWLSAGEAPAFIRMEGQFYVGGPIWAIEMASPVWPKAAPVHDAAHSSQ